jgi:hypothetical protein
MSRIPVPTSQSEALAMLQDRPRRTIGNNTHLTSYPDGCVGLVLHWTEVVTCHPDGSLSLDSGGYETTTTKDRINKALADRGRVYADDFAWYYAPAFDFTARVPFQDGMTVNADGTVRTGDREMAGVA